MWQSREARQDLLLLLATVLFATLLAWQYQLFASDLDIDPPEKKIDIYEMLLLSALLSGGLLIFSIRRLREQRREAALRAEAERRASDALRLAERDPLTNLPNRRFFDQFLEALLAAPPAPGRVHALMLIDLTGFKALNDRHGHPLGDQALIKVAERLMAFSSGREVVARLGGDEFALLAQDLRDGRMATAMAGRILATIEQPFVVDGHHLRVGAGIGIALFPTHGGSPSEILRNADAALYNAKAAAPSAVRLFDRLRTPLNTQPNQPPRPTDRRRATRELA